jgi:hypothetical protein
MRHTLRLQGVIIGHSELEHVDPGTRRAWGSFRPGMGYELIQPVFRLFARAVPRDDDPNGGVRDNAMLDRYHRAREKLPLALEDADGRAIRTTTIHIADYTVEEGSQALELDVLIADDAYWERRLGANP